MRKVTTYIVLLFFLCCGLLLIYRAAQKSSSLTKVDARIIARQVEAVSTQRRSNRYALTFTLNNYQDKVGIYLGTKEQAANNPLISKLDTISLYTFLIDPTVSISKGINLGVNEINLNGASVYKASNRFNIFGGVVFSLLGLVGLFVVTKYKRKKNDS